MAADVVVVAVDSSSFRMTTVVGLVPAMILEETAFDSGSSSEQRQSSQRRLFVLEAPWGSLAGFAACYFQDGETRSSVERAVVGKRSEAIASSVAAAVATAAVRTTAAIAIAAAAVVVVAGIDSHDIDSSSRIVGASAASSEAIVTAIASAGAAAAVRFAVVVVPGC